MPKKRKHKKKTKKKSTKTKSTKSSSDESKVNYFVGIPSKDDFRGHILNIQKKLLEGMRRAEKFNTIRKKKIQEIKRLKLILKGIIILNDKFKEQLPKVRVSLGQKKVERISPPQSVYDYSLQLNKLEKAITDIEGKLKEFEAA